MIKKNALEPWRVEKLHQKEPRCKIKPAISFLFFFFGLKNCSALSFAMAGNPFPAKGFPIDEENRKIVWRYRRGSRILKWGVNFCNNVTESKPD